jgi:primosomal protein N' (replication factor Y)
VSLLARVVVDVTGVDKPFDYLIPDALRSDVVVGSRVRVSLHRREVSAWVMAIVEDVDSDVDAKRLLPIIKVTSIGPSPDVVALVEWAAVRWVSRRRPFFVSASPPKRVPRLVASRYGARNRNASVSDDASEDAALEALFGAVGGVVQCGPASTHSALLSAATRHGPTLVVVPTVVRARRLAAHCRQLGLTTAVYPDDWVAAASGVDVVVGARSTVWASVAQLASIIVIDEHDDTLQEERAPTWHARDVAIERARQAGIACVLVSPVPTLSARQWAHSIGADVVQAHDATDWPTIRVIDRNIDERWASSLVTSELIELLRDHTKRVVCVLNVKGRARAVACDACRTVARCEACGAAVQQPDEHGLSCPRCAATRPVVCLACGSQKMRSIRIGISRLRDELEAAAGRPVQEIKPTTSAIEPHTSVFVGTEAVLHRIDRADVVVFLDIDAELLAPRFRASEQALSLVAHGARLVTGSSTGDSVRGEVVLQTSVPQHEVMVGLVMANLAPHVAAETERRQRLRLPPFGALAEISGAGAPDLAAQLAASLLVQVATSEDRTLVRAASWEALSEALTVALSAVARPKVRVRIAVDPSRA